MQETDPFETNVENAHSYEIDLSGEVSQLRNIPLEELHELDLDLKEVDVQVAENEAVETPKRPEAAAACVLTKKQRLANYDSFPFIKNVRTCIITKNLPFYWK